MSDLIVKPMDILSDAQTASVFSSVREIEQPDMNLPSELVLNSRLQMEGCEMLAKIPAASIACTFFDPQYRGVLDHLRYGNEGKERGQKRCALKQMDEVTIWRFISELDRILLASGHLFLWIDKYHLAEGIRSWISGTSLDVVDFITWNKMKMGMGYRTRRFCEYLVVLQKQPRKAKGVWKIHTIPDVWEEKVKRGNGVHPKPVGLQGELIEAVTNTGDVVVDPAAGSFSVLDACRVRGRNFLGCDLNG